ncbi:hypothetical protein ANN_23199 [Periplaneta americana]|uniref:Uncharacterized protein n=1 Tax=Periplaneta americana TaxID=6978 RepID=A0ABQ8SKI9_PERAM|nr:hypothetical protein ANN_23199 [Periplaneta americana]
MSDLNTGINRLDAYSLFRNDRCLVQWSNVICSDNKESRRIVLEIYSCGVKAWQIQRLRHVVARYMGVWRKCSAQPGTRNGVYLCNEERFLYREAVGPTRMLNLTSVIHSNFVVFTNKNSDSLNDNSKCSGMTVEIRSGYNEGEMEKHDRPPGGVEVGEQTFMGESRNAYRVLVGRPEGKRPLGRPRRRWENNVKIDLREVGYDGRDRINLTQCKSDRWRAYARAAMDLRERSQEKEKLTGQPPFTEQKLLQSTASIQKAGSQ